MIRVVTDTTASVPNGFFEEHNIPVIAQYVHFGQDAYRGYYDISPAQFFEMLPKAPELPKTSAPTVGDFVTLFESLLAEDPDATLLCIHPSTEVSGTVRSAIPAQDMFPKADIHIFDTRSVSLGLGLMVMEAVKMVEAGESLESVLKMLAYMRDNMQVYFVVETLEYLAKGGRIGRASHLVGTLLDIKPILSLVDGTVTSHSKARTRKRSLAEMRQIVMENAQGKAGLHLGIAHAVCREEAEAFGNDLQAVLNPEVYLFTEVGPAIGVHAGPGTLAVGWVLL
nr:DegV family protein [Anaerolineae bacterium]